MSDVAKSTDFNRLQSIFLTEMENIDYYYINHVQLEPTQTNSEVDSLPLQEEFQEFPKDGFFTKSTRKLGIALGVVGLLLLLVSYAPTIAFEISSILNGASVSEVFKRPFIGFGQVLGSQESGEAQPEYQPPLDKSLPLEPTIKIPSIKVDSRINEASLDNYEEALKQGVWRVTDFGTPYTRSKPTILVAHRYGYLAWSNLFRRKSSFYNLPKLKEGDVVEITWGQRKYVYEVYGGEEGEQITDYTADLILYTCESLTSPVRIFRYARLLQI